MGTMCSGNQAPLSLLPKRQQPQEQWLMPREPAPLAQGTQPQYVTSFPTVAWGKELPDFTDHCGLESKAANGNQYRLGLPPLLRHQANFLNSDWAPRGEGHPCMIKMESPVRLAEWGLRVGIKK